MNGSVAVALSNQDRSMYDTSSGQNGYEAPSEHRWRGAGYHSTPTNNAELTRTHTLSAGMEEKDWGSNPNTGEYYTSKPSRHHRNRILEPFHHRGVTGVGCPSNQTFPGNTVSTGQELQQSHDSEMLIL